MEQAAEFVEVETSAGTVRGRWRPTSGQGANSRSAAFLGIPFAEAPVGDLRFQPPVPKEPWEGVLDALEYGATAQRGDPGVTLIPEPSIPGESTLNVNVFTPSPNPVGDEGGLPVLVYIHGGGYFAGSPASPWYDGRNFNRDDVVTVTVSYRLGFTGFGWVEGGSQNRGVRDWLAGLQWVQDNVAQFGGDPNRVTIAGQSAGAGAVLSLLGMEAAQHLFHQVYAISSPIPDVGAAKAKKFAAQMAEKLGVPPTLEGFSAVPEERILQAQAELSDMHPKQMMEMLETGLNMGPTVDGDLIRRPALDSLLAGVGADKRLVIGTTDDEMTMALFDQEKKMKWVPQGFLLAKMGVPKTAQKTYVAANQDALDKGKHFLAGRVITDRMFKVPTLLALRARAGMPTWAYRFAWQSGKFDSAVHCVDVPFFFDCLDGPAMEALTGPNPPQSLADKVHHSAVEFIRTGNPGWPEYTESHPVVRVWNVQPADVTGGFDAVTALLPR